MSQKLEWEGGEHVTVKPYSHVALWAALYWDEPDQDQWSEIRDNSDHSTLKEPTNQPWKRILWFIWCSMIRVIPDHWSWSRLTQRNASFLDSVSVFFFKENLHAGKNCKLWFVLPTGPLRSSSELDETCPWVLDRIRIWKGWFLRRGKYRVPWGKTSRSKGEKQQQTQPAYRVKRVPGSNLIFKLCEPSSSPLVTYC